MATSSIKIYSGSTNWKLYPNKLFIVEDIASYLSYFLPSHTINDFQYIKCELEISINVALPQNVSGEKVNSPIYVSIQNSDSSKVYYYFVKERLWRSKNAVRLELVMDVLNTFKEGEDYAFKENCTIQREHKDRYKLSDTSDFVIDFYNENYDRINAGDYVEFRDYTSDEILAYIEVYSASDDSLTGRLVRGSFEGLYNGRNIRLYLDEEGSYFNLGTATIDSVTIDKETFRVVDYVPESINPILHCNNAEGVKIEKPSPLNIDWYLLYRNQNDPTDSLVNPVECYLIPSSQLRTNSAVVTNGKLTPDFLESGKYYYFLMNVRTAVLSNGVTIPSTSIAGQKYLLLTKEDNGTMTASEIVSTGGANGDSQFMIAQYPNITSITFPTLPVPYVIKDAFIPFTEEADLYYLDDEMDMLFNNTGSYTQTDTINDVDKTDAKNIKIIKLPYCPYDFNVLNDILQIAGDSSWELASLEQTSGAIIRVLKLKNNNTKLSSSWNDTNISPFSLLRDVDNLQPNVNDLRKSTFDSKMLNSEFYQQKIVYDSFTFTFELEKCNLSYYINNTSMVDGLRIKFLVTSTINSKFLMSFENYALNLANENYPKYMPIAVNNEEVLYNVPYINYVRTGYNYDVKNKNLNQASTLVGILGSGVGLGVSLAFPSATLKVAGIVSSVIGMAVSTFNAIKSVQQSELSIQQKITQGKNQTSSVAGSDDVDLRSEYTDNRFKYLVYVPTPIMFNLINDLFYYSGYASNEMKKPTHNNRINFDYLQMTPSFTNEGSISSDCLQELINCFINGVTYIHKVSARSDLAQWDMNQELENWENSLM